jgi:hypothetical protein
LKSIADHFGITRQTLYNRLDRPETTRDGSFWNRLAKLLSVDAEAILDPTMPLPSVYLGTATPAQGVRPIGKEVASLLLDIIEDPAAPKEKKQTARAAILLWLPD